MNSQTIELASKEDIRIVVTDSGLGGVSVLAELEKRLKLQSIYKTAELIFFNALFGTGYGYNSMSSMEEKADVFNKALESMVENYNPDLILIACNTLSIVFPFTKFYEASKIPAVGIVNSGVEQIVENLKEKTNSSILIFGTPTTIESNTHKLILVEKGIDEERIINQSCKLLETEIQLDPNSENVKKMIRKFSEEAKEKFINNEQEIIAALCCTHYGYSFNLFQKIFVEVFGNSVKIINPNNSIINFLFQKRDYKKEELKNIKIKIVSQVEITRKERTALKNILEKEAPLVSEALDNYAFDQHLFQI